MDLIYIYILIEMDEIIEDIKFIEEDIKAIRCGPIQNFFGSKLKFSLNFFPNFPISQRFV